jgi:hypothetical protein
MSDPIDLYKYRGTCLNCGKQWILTREQIDVAIIAELAYSPCCEMPATLVKIKGGTSERNQTNA